MPLILVMKAENNRLTADLPTRKLDELHASLNDCFVHTYIKQTSVRVILKLLLDYIFLTEILKKN